MESLVWWTCWFRIRGRVRDRRRDQATDIFFLWLCVNAHPGVNVLYIIHHTIWQCSLVPVTPNGVPLQAPRGAVSVFMHRLAFLTTTMCCLTLIFAYFLLVKKCLLEPFCKSESHVDPCSLHTKQRHNVVVEVEPVALSWREWKRPNDTFIPSLCVCRFILCHRKHWGKA